MSVVGGTLAFTNGDFNSVRLVTVSYVSASSGDKLTCETTSVGTTADSGYGQSGEQFAERAQHTTASAVVVTPTTSLRGPSTAPSTITVALGAAPLLGQTVTVACTSSSATDVAVTAGATETFEQSDWPAASPRTVELTPQNAGSSASVTISCAVTVTRAGYPSGMTDLMTFTADPPALTLGASAIKGPTGVDNLFSVVLGAAPLVTADVTVTCTASGGTNPAVVSVSSALVFGNGNYAVAQTVTLASTTPGAGPGTTTVTCSARTASGTYYDLDEPVTVELEVPSLALTPSSALSYPLASTLTATLSSTWPHSAKAVVVDCAPGASEAASFAIVPSTLTFGAKGTQVVEVRSVSGQPAASTTVTCAVNETASANSGFTTESTSVGVTTVAPDVIVDPSTYATATTADFTVAVSLPVDPAPGAGDVKVTCTTSDIGVVGVAGGAVSSSLTFSAGSLGPTQLALNGEAGATADGTATVTCTVAVPGTSASTGYSAAQSDAVAVSLVVPRIVTDAEVSGALGPRPHLVMPLTADAGAIANNVVQVHLSAKPVVGQTVVVTVASQSTDDVTVTYVYGRQLRRGPGRDGDPRAAEPAGRCCAGRCEADCEPRAGRVPRA